MAFGYMHKLLNRIFQMHKKRKRKKKYNKNTIQLIQFPGYGLHERKKTECAIPIRIVRIGSGLMVLIW